MTCYHPWTAYQTSTGDVIFNERGADIVRTLELPCNQCYGCRAERARQWAVRCVHESKMHKENCFITLTYNTENIPTGYSLKYRDFQLFMKRLRKKFPGKKISFYMCGEYGETFTRPHYHACLFGIDMPDKKPTRILDEKSKLYESEILENLWGKGYTSLGQVTFESAAYIARYIMKKITGDLAKTHYTFIDENGEMHERKPEFNHMSLKPAIGKRWLEKYHKDVYPSDQVIFNGIPSRPPKYYDQQLQKNNPEIHEEIAWQRYQLTNPEDKTDDRLKTRETVKRAKDQNLKRKIL